MIIFHRTNGRLIIINNGYITDTFVYPIDGLACRLYLVTMSQDHFLVDISILSSDQYFKCLEMLQLVLMLSILNWSSCDHVMIS